MTDDLDRKAALLMGWRECRKFVSAAHSPGCPCEGDCRLLDMEGWPAPTSNPADTRALVQATVNAGWKVDVAHGKIGAFAECWGKERWVSGDANPTDGGPNYDLIATTRACVAALESMEAQG